MTPVPHLSDLLAHAPETFTVIDADGWHRLADVTRSVATTSEALRSAGVSDRDRVLLRLGRSARDVSSFFAVLAVGAVVVPVGEETPPARLRQIQQNCGAAFTLDADGRLETHEEGVQRGARSAAAETAVLVYTSGSSGVPKGVVCSHASVLAAARGIQERLQYRPDDRVGVVLPLAFDYGLYQVFLALLGGSTVVLYESGAAGPGLAARLRADGVTVLPSLPALTQTIVAWAGRRGRTLEAVRLATSTGADFPAGLATRLREALPGATVVPMYGLTECKRATIHSGDPDEPHSSGTAIPGCSVEVVDLEGRPVATGGTGEIVVHGANVMDGYWPLDDAELNARFTIAGGGRSVRTGDLGRLDEHGRLHVLGRTDDMFKRNGYRTSVGEVEDAIGQVPGVDLVCVRPPREDASYIAWYAGTVDPETLRAAVHERLEADKVPDVLERLDAMPVNANGKIDRARLASAAAGVGA